MRFSARKFVLASLRQHWRIHAAVAMAVATATAVLTGALVVGDSVRGSLRHLALDRLGQTDEVVVADRLFRQQLAAELQAEAGFSSSFEKAIPAILLQASLETASGDQKHRAGQVTVLGIEDAFWVLGKESVVAPLKPSQIFLNEPLAKSLNVRVGEEVILRIGQASQIPADSPLGRKTDSIRNRRLQVARILPAEGLGRFGLRPNQQLPLNAFVAMGTLQGMLDQPGKVNAIFVSKQASDAEPANDSSVLQELLHPSLADLGFLLSETPHGYANFASTRMLIDEPANQALMSALKNYRLQPAFTYLANYIQTADGSAKVPYSTVTALDLQSEPPLGPFVTSDGKAIGPLADDEIVLNRWTADDMAKQGTPLKPGDEIVLVYFEPESTHGEVREQTARFRLKAIAEMTSAAADRNFTPELPGVTDQKSIANWDPPFPYDDRRVRSRKPHDEDEAYWDEFKATPKAFVSLNTGHKLWKSRFGDTTTLRIVPKTNEGLASLESKILAALPPEQLGFQVMPVRAWALKASAGTTPFNALFIGFSFFLVLAAVILIALLFRLGIEQRASEIAVLAAVGLRWKRIALLLTAEMVVVSLLGIALGAVAGVGYAWLMLVGLKTLWLDAIRTPFLQLYVTPLSLIVGVASGLMVALLTTRWTLWRMRHVQVRKLLAGQTSDDAQYLQGGARSKWLSRFGWSFALLAFGLTLLGSQFSREAQAGVFFGSGMLALVVALLLINDRLKRPSTTSLIRGGPLALVRLAMRNAARNPRRSALTIGLVAAASFLIVAISAFRLDPAAEGIGKQSGSGGFGLVAEASQSIYKNLNDDEDRDELGFSSKEDSALRQAKIEQLRVAGGDDASCLNLYQTAQPRAIGLPQTFLDRGGFDWAGTLAETAAEKANPWLLLEKPARDAAIPVVLDANTAMYGLHKSLGDTLQLTDGRAGSVTARIVGLLKNSIFQGDMLMSDHNFLKLFPDVNGFRVFLVEAPVSQIPVAQRALETALADYGFDAERSTDRLANFFAVQNTYLSTFQSLGGLGLLLGTFGVAAVQLRSVIERRGELALLQAIGFRRRRLSMLVMLENAALLIGGLIVGVGTALIVVLPHWIAGDATAPWHSLVYTLLAVLLVGILSGAWAVRAVLKAPLMAVLRTET